MKTNTFRNTAVAFALAASLPASAQTAAQLKQENARLKAQIEALQAQGCQPSRSAGNAWKQGDLSATIDAIRVGRRPNHPGQPDGHITVTLTVRNTGRVPIALNYSTGTFRLVDEAGGEYRATLRKASGIPTATANDADPSAIIAPGNSRSVTFSAFRVPSASDPLPSHFDINATFVQIEETGQGQVRKVRDFAIAFTNVPASRP